MGFCSQACAPGDSDLCPLPCPLCAGRISLGLPTAPLSGRRNQNYLDILRLLSLGDKQLSSFDISLRFTHLFWFGDLNYRLDMDIQVRGTRARGDGGLGRAGEGCSMGRAAKGEVGGTGLWGGKEGGQAWGGGGGLSSPL